jgi:hypothetical protein
MANKSKSGPKSLGFKKFMWNSETKAIMGRTVDGWGKNCYFVLNISFLIFSFFLAKIILFYLIFYVVLIAFSLGMFFVFQTTLSDDHPKYLDIIGKEGPGLSFRPNYIPNTKENFFTIQYNKSNPKFYVDEVKQFLKSEFQIVLINSKK